MGEELTPEDKDYIMELTKKSEEDVENYYKLFKDRFPSGKIEMKELVKMVKEHFEKATYKKKTSNPDAFCDYAFKAYDTDENGFIGFREVIHAMFMTSDDGPKEEKMKFTFQMFDFSKNGEVDKKELAGFMSAVFPMTDDSSDEELEGATDLSFSHFIMKEVDANKDGVMTQEEFVAACKKDKDFFTAMCGEWSFGSVIGGIFKSNLEEIEI